MRDGRIARVSIISRLTVLGIIPPIGKAICFVRVHIAARLLAIAATEGGRKGRCAD